MNKKYLLASASMVALTPIVALAQAGTLQGVLRIVGDILGLLIPLLITIAVIVFFWGLIKYLMSAGDAEARGSGINLMIMGIVALFVMVAVWGLVGILADTFGVQPGGGAPNPGGLVPSVR